MGWQMHNKNRIIGGIFFLLEDQVLKKYYCMNRRQMAVVVTNTGVHLAVFLYLMAEILSVYKNVRFGNDNLI